MNDQPQHMPLSENSEPTSNPPADQRGNVSERTSETLEVVSSPRAADETSVSIVTSNPPADEHSNVSEAASETSETVSSSKAPDEASGSEAASETLETVSDVSNPALEKPVRQLHHQVSIRSAEIIFRKLGESKTQKTILNWCKPDGEGNIKLDCGYDGSEYKWYTSADSIVARLEKDSNGFRTKDVLLPIVRSMLEMSETELENFQPTFQPTPETAAETSETVSNPAPVKEDTATPETEDYREAYIKKSEFLYDKLLSTTDEHIETLNQTVMTLKDELTYSHKERELLLSSDHESKSLLGRFQSLFKSGSLKTLGAEDGEAPTYREADATTPAASSSANDQRAGQ